MRCISVMNFQGDAKGEGSRSDVVRGCIDAQDNSGRTALHDAVALLDERVVSTLLQVRDAYRLSLSSVKASHWISTF